MTCDGAAHPFKAHANYLVNRFCLGTGIVWYLIMIFNLICEIIILVRFQYFLIMVIRIVLLESKKNYKIQLYK